MQTDVSIVACNSYDLDDCRRALKEVLAPIGGLDWVTEGMKIAVKVNLVAAMKPEEAATTHPSLLCALCEMLTERGASVVLGDSPGGLFTPAHLNHVYTVSGMHEAESFGAALNDDFSQSEASFPEAKVAKKFTYTGYLDNADAIIDFCKLKSHGMMGMTNAAKNFFGVIPGTMKPEYHYKYPNVADFADMLVDLNEYFKPRLAICDAIVGMEGNGPTKGTPIRIGALAASVSTHKLDLACAALLGLGCKDVPTLQAAFDRGLIPQTAEELTVSGDLKSLIVPNFHAPKAQGTVHFSYGGKGLLGKVIGSVIQTTMTPIPMPNEKSCIGCKKCANICPAKAITMKNGIPQIDRQKCIHCFCCQEFCPKGAMYVHRSFIAKLLNK